MESWRVIEDGALDGLLNMATDRAILTASGEGKAQPTLRLYGWKEKTLTVGYAQNSGRDVDLARCDALGIPVVPRPTGGRALLHDKELTYSLTAPIPHPRFPANLREAFCAVSEALRELQGARAELHAKGKLLLGEAARRDELEVGAAHRTS